MSFWIVVAGVPLAFLGGGLLLSEALCRRRTALDDAPWSEAEPPP